MSYARTEALMKSLDKVRQELARAMAAQVAAYERAGELSATGAEQELMTDKPVFYAASARERAVGDAFGRACASLRDQERAIERELSSAEFFGRITSAQIAAVDETMGEEA